MKTLLRFSVLPCLLLVACDPPPPPSNVPPPADHHLEVWAAGKQQWSDDLANVTFPSWAFGVDTLGQVPSLGLAPDNQVTLKYTIEGAEVQFNAGQLLALARDPIELRDTIQAVPAGDLGAFEKVVDGCELPDGVLLDTQFDVFAKPPQARAQSTVATSSFYPRCHSPQRPTGPASVPNGQSSIATLETFRAGLCAQSVPLDDVLSRVLAGLDAEIATGLDSSGCVDATGGGAALAYVTHQSVRVPDTFPTGAFTLAYSFHGQIGAPLPDIDTGLTASFRWWLDHGRPGVTGTVNALSASGYKSTETTTELQAAVTQTIPAVLGAEFDSRLATPFPLDTPGASVCATDADCSGQVCLPSKFRSGQKTCQALPVGLCELDPAGPQSVSATVEQCGSLAKFLEPNVRAGGATMNLSQAQVDAAWVTASEQTEDGRYKHLRCRRPDPQSKARCEYVVDVKRLNVKPGQLDLVFFDDAAETSQSAFALNLALVRLGSPDALCQASASGERHALQRSSFKVVARSHNVLECLGNNL